MPEKNYSKIIGVFKLIFYIKASYDLVANKNITLIYFLQLKQ